MNSNKRTSPDSPVQYLKYVGPKRAESFSGIGINTIRDILFYFPTRHLDRSTVLSVSKAYQYVRNGYDGELTIIGKVAGKVKKRFGKREVFTVEFSDGSGIFECVWFQGIKYFENVFEPGNYFAVSSKPTLSRFGSLQFIHPDFDRISEEESDSLLNTGKIIPFYRIPKKLKESNIGDFSIRKIISLAVEQYADLIEETLPEFIISESKLISLKETIRNYHFPVSSEMLMKAKRRLKFEELFYIQILVALKKYNYQHKLSGNKMEIRTSLIPDFLKTLPFKLTSSQLKVLSEIKKDMLSSKPMNRLLQGDVGSGKTIVALIAMLIAADNNFQSVMMAPTEILADQHAKRISDMMNKLKQVHKQREIKVALLIGGQSKSVRNKKLIEKELKEADIILGTHALFEEPVQFSNLGLVIVDEQHRFGVEQRARLLAKAAVPDVLVMSATPIPRTLSLTLYGDLDVSVITEMPENRKPVKTILRGESALPKIYQFIHDKCRAGYQAFIVYPLVEESEKLELKAATTYFEKLRSNELKNLRLGLIHGRMSWQEKEEIMLRFRAKEFDVLISTTVIEVGIDIPDANIILINDANRFGLSQLHQLRGRTGRSDKQAYCILVANDKLVSSAEQLNLDEEYMSSVQKEIRSAVARLKAMVKYNDGFKIAEEDMKLRGPGDVFGTMQSGFPELKYANLSTDTELLIEARKHAFKIVNSDPGFKRPQNKIISAQLSAYHSSALSYIKIA
ncbi:MAG: ATP-dependent DNA helicase RecG [Ignavibacteriaceae bacterium]